jgi:hypothetical protein
MKKIKYTFPLAAIIVILFACQPIEHMSPVPYIEFVSFTVFDTIDMLGNKGKGGILKFYFEDGDGDIGFENSDNQQDDTLNLTLNLYRKVNRQMVPAASDDPLLPYPYRIPYILREGQNKIVKGHISVTLMYLFYNKTDTIMYDFHLHDRAMNESNIASTNEIIISENNTY